MKTCCYKLICVLFVLKNVYICYKLFLFSKKIKVSSYHLNIISTINWHNCIDRVSITIKKASHNLYNINDAQFFSTDFRHDKGEMKRSFQQKTACKLGRIICSPLFAILENLGQTWQMWRKMIMITKAPPEEISGHWFYCSSRTIIWWISFACSTICD